MHFVVQFPIIDFRTLLPGKAGKVSSPNWLKLDMLPKPFIRRFGRVKERNSGGSEDWTGEAHFCNSHKAMRYSDLHKQGFSITPDIKSTIYNSYRRFYSNGYYVNKIEAGFVDNLEELVYNSGVNGIEASLDDVLSHYVKLAVTINQKQTQIYKAGPLLAEHYFKVTTLHDKVLDNSQEYVIDGELNILLVYAATDGIRLPKNVFQLDEFELPDEIGVLKLYGYKLKHDSYNLKVWLIEIPIIESKLPKAARNVLRNLRINLFRIHLEKETIRIILNAIHDQIVYLEKESPEAEKLNAYIKKSTEKLFQKSRYGVKQETILAFALHSENVVAADSFSSLEESIYYFNNQYTTKNVEKILTTMAPKTILFICTSPKGKNPLDFGNEYQSIQDGLESSSDQSNFQFMLRASVKKSDLFDILNRYKPDYIHISMHASLTEGLYFEDENRDKSPMPVDEFEKIMKLYSEVHFPISVVISACHSKAHAEAIKNYCDFVVGTQAAFPADAGVLYARSFYSTLFSGNSTNILVCHKAGQLAIELSNPPYEPINEYPVNQIPVLL